MKLLASQQVDVAQKKIADPAFVASADEVSRLANEMSEQLRKGWAPKRARRELSPWLPRQWL